MYPDKTAEPSWFDLPKLDPLVELTLGYPKELGGLSPTIERSQLGGCTFHWVSSCTVVARQPGWTDFNSVREAIDLDGLPGDLWRLAGEVGSLCWKLMHGRRRGGRRSSELLPNRLIDRAQIELVLLSRDLPSSVDPVFDALCHPLRFLANRTLEQSRRLGL
ncbi:MAG: hypothetical protein AAFV43_03570 [Planctomycetota bacterium]